MSLLIYSICISEVEEDTDSIQPPPQKKLRPSLFAHYTDSVPEPEDNGRLEKLLSHYIDTVNAVSFDCDTKLADICRQKEFQPLAYLFESILTVPASSAGRNCLSHWCLPSVHSSEHFAHISNSRRCHLSLSLSLSNCSCEYNFWPHHCQLWPSVLLLALASRVLGLGLGTQVLGLGLGLDTPRPWPWPCDLCPWPWVPSPC